MLRSIKNFISFASLFFYVPSCAHVEETTQNVDRPIKSDTKLSNPIGDPKYISNCRLENKKTVVCQFENEYECDKSSFDVVDRTVHTEKSTSTLSKILEYAGGALLLGGGTGVVLDAGNVPSSDDRLNNNPVGRTGAYAIGGGLLALGTTLLVIGITDSFRAVDSFEHAGNLELLRNSERVLCERKKLANSQLGILIGGREVSKESTSPKGTLRIELEEVVPGAMLAGKSPLVELHLNHNGNDIAKVGLSKYREYLCGKVLDQILESNDTNLYSQFLQEFPDATELLGANPGFAKLAHNAEKCSRGGCRGRTMP